MTADETALRNQKLARPVYWQGAGSLRDPYSSTEQSRHVTVEGRIPFFWSPLLRNKVELMQFNGKDIKLWIGRGWLSRDVAVSGSRAAVNEFYVWFSHLSGKGAK